MRRSWPKPGRNSPPFPSIGDNDQPLDVLRRPPRPSWQPSGGLQPPTSESVPRSRITTRRSPFSGALGFDSISANHLFTPRAFQPVGTGALRWRLFDFGKVDAEVAQARGANR